MPLLHFKPRPGHLEGAGKDSPSRDAPTAPTLLVQSRRSWYQNKQSHHRIKQSPATQATAPLLTAGPSVLLRVFFMCSLTCCSPCLLPCLAAIQRLRWKPVSPEMAMCMLMVSKKRTREPWDTLGEKVP